MNWNFRCNMYARRTLSALFGAVLICGSAAPRELSADNIGLASCAPAWPVSATMEGWLNRPISTAWIALADAGAGSPPQSLHTSEPMIRLASNTTVRSAGPDSVDRFLSAISSSVDKASIDPERLSERLDELGGAEAIVEWVAHNIRFEAYRGLLRGSKGTLISAAGNALDQSILLAQMLRDAAYDARIVSGTLSRQDASRLILSMFAPTQDIATGIEFDISLFAAKAGIPERDLHAFKNRVKEFDLQGLPIYRDALAARDLIIAQFQAAGIKLGSDLTETLIEDASDYAWVQYRTSAAGSWTDAHPAFGAAPIPANAEVSRTITDAIPPDLQHRVRVEFTLERKYGDQLQTQQLMEPWERPVANLIGIPITIGNTVLGVSPDTTLAELADRVAVRALFAPVFMDGLAPQAQAFDLLGNVVPPDAASSAEAAVIQTVTKRGSQAANALGGLGPPSGERSIPLALTAQWIDFTLIAPGGVETRYRRYVFDRLTPESRLSGEIELQDESVVLNGLLTHQVFMINPGALSPAYLASEMLNAATGSRKPLQALSRRQSQPLSPAELARAMKGNDVKEHLLLYAAFDALESDPGTVAYRAEPSLVVLFNEFTPGEVSTNSAGVDIVHNARRSLRISGDQVLANAAAGILAGTWETSVERFFVESRLGGATHGTYQAFSAVRGMAKLLAPGTDVAASSANLGPILPLVQADLSRGFAVVLPDGGTDSRQPDAWWRVDPRSGETLGMGMRGRGISATERAMKEAMTVGGLVISVAFFIGSVPQCSEHPDPACCIVQSAGYLGVGILGGAVVGAVTKSALAGIGALLAIDIGGGIGGAIGVLPDFCR